MKVEAIHATMPSGRRLWLGFIWQLHPRLSKHYAFSARWAAQRLIWAHRKAKRS